MRQRTLIVLHDALLSAQAMGSGNRQEARHEAPKVAVARKIAVILHHMWIDGTSFRWTNKEKAVTHA
jgi:hypothetical protein